MTIAIPTSAFREATWIVSPTAGKGTHTTIAAATAAASAGDIIMIREGTYTENFTAKACTYTSFPGSPATIVGKITYTAAGTVNFNWLTLQTNSDFCLVVSGSAASKVLMQGVIFNCTNNTGISFTVANAAAAINISSSSSVLGTTGIGTFASSSTGTLVVSNFTETNTGASVTGSTVSAGVLQMIQCIMATPITVSLTAFFIAGNLISSCTNATCLVFTGTSTGQIYYNSLGSGTASAINVGAGCTLSLYGGDVNSSNTNAIDGSGTLNYSFLAFSGSSKIIVATLTQANPNSGSFTPAIAFGGSSTGVTYSNQQGRYFRNGNTVFFTIDFTLTNNGSGTGAATITGMPFTSANNGVNYSFLMVILLITTTTGNTYLYATLAPNTSTLSLFAESPVSGTQTALLDTYIGNTCTVRVQGTYLI